jgi:hypothetical protein
VTPPQPPVQISVGGLLGAGLSALTGGPSFNAKFSGGSEPSTETVKARALQQNSPRNRVRDVYEALLRVKDARSLVTVSLRDRDLFDMMIERVAEPRIVEDGSSAKFQVDLKNIRTAASKTVASPKPAEARSKTPTNKGAQAAKPDADPKQRRKTLMKAIEVSLADGG